MSYDGSDLAFLQVFGIFCLFLYCVDMISQNRVFVDYIPDAGRSTVYCNIIMQ